MRRAAALTWSAGTHGPAPIALSAQVYEGFRAFEQDFVLEVIE
jgi:hypothetical protein